VRNTEVAGLEIGAGVINGSFSFPMRLERQWTWENMWLGWSFIGLLLMPLVLTQLATRFSRGDLVCGCVAFVPILR
jgi:hypothetical protein